MQLVAQSKINKKVLSSTIVYIKASNRVLLVVNILLK